MPKTERFSDTLAFKIASVVILSAIVTIFTIVVRIPIAPTRGYVNLGDVAIFFIAFIFGPVSAFLAGGLGTGIADLLGGYGKWAPVSFIVHGHQGFFIAIVYNIFLKENCKVNIFLQALLCFLVGAIVMVLGYFLAGLLLVGPGAALVEIPGNIIQNLAGIAGGMTLAVSVKKAYPPVIYFRW
ncbi:MAG: ECF transporter S component [Spirochaetaceae bacterium]|nr:ECF transporter S component [Spirochaetaceae bacterium]